MHTNQWVTTKRRWHDPHSIHMWELCKDGKLTGIIVKDYTKHPECDIYNWDYINTVFGSEEEFYNNNEVKKAPLTQKIEDMSDTPFIVAIEGDTISVTIKPQPAVEPEVIIQDRMPSDTVTEYIVRFIWPYGEDSEDGADHVICTSMKEAKEYESWLKSKYSSMVERIHSFVIYERQVTVESKVI